MRHDYNDRLVWLKSYVEEYTALPEHSTFDILTEAEYRAALEAQDYKVERFDDLTAAYLPFIKEGLRRFHDCLQNAKFPPETLTTLMREGNIWLARSQALETGQLSFVHIHARRISPSLTGEDDVEEPDAAPEHAAENDE